MKITAIIEDTHGMVVAVVVNDLTEHGISPAIPRSELMALGKHVAELAGYDLNCETFELTPINAPSAQT